MNDLTRERYDWETPKDIGTTLKAEFKPLREEIPFQRSWLLETKTHLIFMHHKVTPRDPEFEVKYNIPHPQDIPEFEDYFGQYEQELPLVQENSVRSFDYIYDFIKRADRLEGKDRFDAFYWIVELFNNIPAERYTEDTLTQDTMDEIENDMAHVLACKENEEQPNYLI